MTCVAPVHVLLSMCFLTAQKAEPRTSGLFVCRCPGDLAFDAQEAMENSAMPPKKRRWGPDYGLKAARPHPVPAPELALPMTIDTEVGHHRFKECPRMGFATRQEPADPAWV